MDSIPSFPAPTASSGLELVLCPSWEALCEDLARELDSAPADVFASQLVVVEGAAAKRSLSQELARRGGGICAGIDFVGLRQLRRMLELALLGIEAGTDPWRSRGLALAVLDVIDEVVAEPWFAPVAHHLQRAEGGPRPGRRLATADRIARLLLGYCRTSPAMVRAWSSGSFVDAAGGRLPERALWQPRVWNLVRDSLQEPDPVSRHDAMCRAVREAGDLGLPEQRLRLADATPCQPLDRELVAALAERLPVSLRQVVAGGEDSRLRQRWGRSRTLGLQRWAELASSQRWAGTPSSGEPLPPLVDVHASHGPDRQVEVLREVLCALFEDDPTLEPRDVVVASTDLDAHAPLVRAAFCLDADVVGRNLHPGHGLRVQLADASLSQPNQVLGSLKLLLDLAGDRGTAQDLVDLCGSTPVATRFGLGEDQLGRIHRLVADADVRWGLDGRHRSAFGLGQVRQSTWLAGVERVLVGISMGPEPLGWIRTALPVEQVDSTDVMAAGVLAEIVSRTRKLVAEWHSAAPIGEWIGRLNEALDLLCTAEGDDAWQLTRARSELADLADLTVERTADLTLGDLQALFGRLLRTSGGRPNFGNGSLVVCSLEDLADTAHRVVVVLGLDDRSFPRRPALDGDDLTVHAGLDAESDPRARSRQVLLDAVAGARERLVVVHQGFTARTNEAVPEPVGVVDLLDACVGPVTARRHQHSLQPQSGGNFAAEPGELPFSFDRAALSGAQARELLLDGPPTAEPPRWSLRLPAAADADAASSLDLAQVSDFYRHPACELLRRRLGVTMGEWDSALADELPIEPNGLQEWTLGDRMVRLALQGLDPQQVAAAERLRGDLPPGQLGSRTLSKLMPVVEKVVNSAMREQQAMPVDLDCELALPGAAGQLTGRVRVHDATIVSLAFSRTNAMHLLQAWFELLLVQATRPAPALGWRAVHIGRDAIATLTAPPPEECARLLTELCALRERGLEQLVPLPVKTAATFTRATPLRPFRDHDPEAKAVTEFRYEHDADWARFVGNDLVELRRIPSEPNDPGVRGPSRFDSLSDWLFAPVREHLAVGNLR